VTVEKVEERHRLQSMSTQILADELERYLSNSLALEENDLLFEVMLRLRTVDNALWEISKHLDSARFSVEKSRERG